MLEFGTTLRMPWRRALGSLCSEAPRHLWSLWAVTRDLARRGPLVRPDDIGWPHHGVIAMMDPINLVVFAPIYALAGGGAMGATLAWNALIFASLALGTIGTALLTRRLVGDRPWAALLATAITVGNPAILDFPWLGRTEFLPAQLMPLQLYLLHRFLCPRRPQDRRWRVGVAAGLVLAAVALGGWYLAVFALLVEVPVSLTFAFHAAGVPGRVSPPRLRAAIERLLLVALVALVPVIPALLVLLRHPPTNIRLDGVGGFTYIQDPRALLRMTPPSPALVPYLPAYAGLVALALAVLGAVVRPRRAAGWLLLALGLFILALGPTILRPIEAPGVPSFATPLYVVTHWFPRVRVIHAWPRLGHLTSLPLAIAAAEGFAAVARPRAARPVMAMAAAAALPADQANFPVAYRFDRPSFEAAAPSVLVDALAKVPPGPVMLLPIEVPNRDGCAPIGVYRLWSMTLDRAVTASDVPPYDTQATGRFGQQLIRLQQGSRRVGDLTDLDSFYSGLRRSAEAGVAAIGLLEARPRSRTMGLFLRSVLGEPTAVSGRAVVWDLAAALGEGSGKTR